MTMIENRELDWTLFDRLLGCNSERFLDLVEAAQLNPATDFCFADLRGIEIGDADLRSFDFTSSDLSGANLAGANLAGVNLTDANLAGANLAGANLAGANLHNADLRQADLIDSNLNGANLTGAKIFETELAFWNTTAHGQVGPAAVPALIAALGSLNTNVRAGAARALRQIGPAAVPALIAALGNAEERVRRSAARVLGRIGPVAVDAVPTLIAARSDADRMVREDAALALKRIRPAATETVPALPPASGYVGDLLITPESIIANLRAGSKKQALQELAKKAAELTGQHERAIFDVLLERERLGTTGVGHGIAIPHGKLANLEHVYGVFARLERPIDFDAIDDQPVDLMFLLLAPEAAGADHLKALARVSRLLRDGTMCDKLRGSNSAEAIYVLLNGAGAIAETG